MKKINTCLKYSESTIDIIKLFGEVELARLRNPGNDNSEKLKHIAELIVHGNEEIQNIEPTFEELEKLITYTYR